MITNEATKKKKNKEVGDSPPQPVGVTNHIGGCF